jgi:histidinol-phosphate/aromatic aminotransferase/cobyric acid decarboxylase-like protein
MCFGNVEVEVSEPSRVHGGVSSEELLAWGHARSELLDLSVNVNPWGPHPEVARAVQQAALSTYPQPWAAAARSALANVCDVEPSRISVGHGSTELLWAAVSLLRGCAGPLVIAGPTFSEPQLAAAAHAVPTFELRAHARDGFALDLNLLSRSLDEQAAAGVYICQPNNPDGSALPAVRVRELCAAHPKRLFILDQAFLALSERHADLSVRFPDNVLLVRSLTKEHALPGLRVGYALAAPDLIARLNARRPSWMVSNLAEAAVVAACQQGAYVREVRDKLLGGRAALMADCRGLGLSVVDSIAPYFMLRVQEADALRQRLLARHAIGVRSCSSFGLPEYVRIAGCGPVERARLLTALRAEVAS